MAFDFSKLNFFNRLGGRARIFVLVAVVAIIILFIYLVARYFGGDRTVGPSRVASAPAGLQSVPGGQVTSQYYQALMQANVQRAEQAKITGTSAVATMIDPGGQQAVGDRKS